MTITAEITGIKYTPKLGRSLKTYPFSDLGKALSSDASFLLVTGNESKIAVSWWFLLKEHDHTRMLGSMIG